MLDTYIIILVVVEYETFLSSKLLSIVEYGSFYQVIVRYFFVRKKNVIFCEA